MSVSTSNPQDLADLLQRLEIGEGVTKTQVQKAKACYTSLDLELQSYKYICTMDKSPSKLEEEKRLENELENLKKEHSAVLRELEQYKSSQGVNRKANIDPDRQALEQFARRLRDDNVKLQYALGNLSRDHNKAIKELELYKNKEKMDRRSHMGEKENLARKLIEENDKLKREMDNFRAEHSTAIKELELYRNKEKFERNPRIGAEHREKEKFSSKRSEENEKLQQDLEKLRKEHSAAMEELNYHRKANVRMEKGKGMGQEKGQSKAMAKLRQQDLHWKEENKRLVAQINELRSRLSAMVGHKLSAGNPNIADLSDPYRPTNIAEQFRQLYDDEWVNAFEELEQNISSREEDLIDILAKIIKDVDHFCGKAGIQQIDRLKYDAKLAVLEPHYQPDEGERQPVKSDSSAVMSQAQDEDVDKLMRDFRKCFGILSKTSLTKLFYDVYMSPLLWNTKTILPSQGLNDFVEKTLELVWMMKIQDPPMELTWSKEGDRFDKNMFTFYTKEGNTISQCVWPAVVMHLDGYLMSKGVVQGK